MPCNYPGQKVTFHVEEGSNPVYFAVLVEFEDGDGDVVQVDLMEANSGYWTPMRESWGSICILFGRPYRIVDYLLLAGLV